MRWEVCVLTVDQYSADSQNIAEYAQVFGSVLENVTGCPWSVLRLVEARYFSIVSPALYFHD